MGKNGKEIRGIAAIYRTNVQNAMLFGAVQYARIQNPEANVKETIKNVAEAFGMELNVDAAEQAYYRTEKIFKEGGGL